MVPDTPDVEAVLFGENGVAEGLAAGKIVVDMSSISPIATKDFAEASRRSAATISTRRSRAARSAPRRRRLTIMVGGTRGGVRRGSSRSSS